MPSLMVTPQRYQDESLLGYRCRVALENGFVSWPAFMRAFLSEAIHSGRLQKASLLPSTRELLGVELADPAPTSDVFRLYRYRRVCPMCLEQASYHREAWTVALLPHCDVHRYRLVDRCPACGKALQHIAAAANFCSCGYDLRYFQPDKDFESCELERIICAMSAERSIESAAIGPSFCSLSLTAIQRVSLLLGSYAAYQDLDKPRKVAIRSDVCIAAKILSAADNVVADWPKGFDALIEATIDTDKHRIQAHFGYLYQAIYRDLCGSEFQFLRDALDDYIRRRWDGLVTSKNRFQSEDLRQNPPYLSSKRVKQLTGVSCKKCHAWVRQGKIDGLLRTTAGFRRQVLIVEDQLNAVTELARSLTLAEAASVLGLPRRRLLELLVAGVIDGYHDRRGCVWQISQTALRDFRQRLLRESDDGLGPSHYRSLESILRHSMSADLSFVDLIQACLKGAVQFYAGPHSRLIDIQICKTSLDSWIATRSRGFSIPEVAKRLNIKQEVAYHLVKKGLIHAQAGGRTGFRVLDTDMATFQRTFCLARDVAAANGVSSRTLIAELRRQDIVPVAGRDIDGCRQYVFLRDDIERAVAS